MSELAGIRVTPVRTIAARRLDESWDWADANRPAIEAYWAGLTQTNPTLYNGRVLVRRRQALEDGRLSLDYIETDYASFLTFRDGGFPDPSAGNAYAMAALRSADGAFLLGRMAEHTANAGKIYFPAGTPEPRDVLPDGAVDLAGSVLRELEEETGLTPADVEPTDDWTVAFAGARTAMMRDLRLPGPAEMARERIIAFLRADERPELSDISIVRSVADIDREAMPPFMQAFLRFSFERDGTR